MKNRSLPKMLLLSIVTLGIYRLYWFIKTRREMMDRDPSVKILSPLLLIIPIVVVVIALVVSLATSIHGRSSKISCQSSLTSSSASTDNLDAQASNGASCGSPVAAIIGGVVLYLGIFVAFILFLVFEWSYARGVETVTGGQLSFVIGLVVLLLVPDGIDILIIQDSFNKLAVVGTAPHAPTS